MKIVVSSAMMAGARLAHAINVVKMAQGFARCGHDVAVVSRESQEKNVRDSDLQASYALTETLTWFRLPRRKGLHRVKDKQLFAKLAMKEINDWQADMVYVRNFHLAHAACEAGVPTIVESHAHPGDTNPMLHKLAAMANQPALRVWVTISHRLKEFFVSIGVPAEKILVLADAVDLQQFSPPPKAELPVSPYSDDKPNIVYTGHLYDYKGIPTIVEAAAKAPEYQFHLIGGLADDITRIQSSIDEHNLSNVKLHGSQPHSAMPAFLWHADVLLLPPSANHPSAAWTSPVKLGEYLASGVPVIATSILALRDWLTGKEVEFVTPDDSTAMLTGIHNILQNPTHASTLSTNATTAATKLSYQNRCSTILNKIT